jgi:hypothetical protein
MFDRKMNIADVPAHAYWEGPEPCTIRLGVESLRGIFPNLKVWTEDECLKLMAEVDGGAWDVDMSKMLACQRSDYFRLLMLYEYGGVYVDTDMVAFRPLTNVIRTMVEDGYDHAAYNVLYKNNAAYNNAFLMSQPGGKVVTEWLRRAKALVERCAPHRLPYRVSIGPAMQDGLMRDWGFKRANTLTVDRAMIESTDAVGHQRRQERVDQFMQPGNAEYLLRADPYMVHFGGHVVSLTQDWTDDELLESHTTIGELFRRALGRGKVKVRVVEKGRECIVVGNGPSTLRYKAGDLIDSFGTVIRCNNFLTMDAKVWEYTGWRTDIWASVIAGVRRPEVLPYPYTLFTVHHEINPSNPDSKGPKSVQTDYMEALNNESWWPSNWGRVGNELIDALAAELESVPHYTTNASSGMKAVAWAMQRYDKVTVHGFDHFSDGNLHHYFDRTKMPGVSGHDGQAEATIFKKWEAAGRVQTLADAFNLEPEPVQHEWLNDVPVYFIIGSDASGTDRMARLLWELGFWQTDQHRHIPERQRGEWTGECSLLSGIAEEHIVERDPHHINDIDSFRRKLRNWIETQRQRCTRYGKPGVTLHCPRLFCQIDEVVAIASLGGPVTLINMDRNAKACMNTMNVTRKQGEPFRNRVIMAQRDAATRALEGRRSITFQYDDMENHPAIFMDHVIDTLGLDPSEHERDRSASFMEWHAACPIDLKSRGRGAIFQ